MAMQFSQIGGMVMVTVYSVLGGLALAGVIYFFYWIYMRQTQKKYFCLIYEARADGGYKANVGTVIRKNYDKITGNYRWYVQFKGGGKAKSITEPNDACIERVGKNERIILIKKGNDFVPAEPKIMGQMIHYVPMSYDMDSFRVNETLRRREKYKNEPSKWAAMQPFIITGVLVVMMIVVVFLTFKYAEAQTAATRSYGIQISEDLTEIARYAAAINSNANNPNNPQIPIREQDEDPNKPLY